MARMFPQSPGDDCPTSESKVFERLRDDLADAYVVVHAQRYVRPMAGRKRAFEGEADFVVIDPNGNYVTLEVKGGRISRTRDGWVSKDKNGKSHKIKDPAKQAQTSAHAIHEYLKNHRKFRPLRVTPNFGWGVVFPDVDADRIESMDLRREFVIDGRDLVNTQTSIERLFQVHGLVESGGRKGFQKLVAMVIAPEFELFPSLATRFREEELVLFRLTEEQRHVLEAFQEVKRVGVKGGAGTGKTILALEKAKQEAADEKRVLLLCYNRHLAEHLARDAQGFTVKHFHGFCRDMARAAGVPFQPPSSGSGVETFWNEQSPDILITALTKLPDERWDSVIVDEGQDFREYWWMALETALKDPEKGFLWAFYDPNQNIYDGGVSATLDLTPAVLKFNCRNTKRIAEFSFAMIEAELKLHIDAPEGSPVTTIVCADEKEMVRAVRSQIHELINVQKLRTDQVIVLSPFGTRTSSLWKEGRLGNFELVNYPSHPGPGQIQFATLHGFKGLEADAVIVCEISASDVNYKKGARTLYVATSRAKHHLVFITRAPQQHGIFELFK